MPGKMHQVMGEKSWESLSECDKQAWGLKPGFPQEAPAFIKDFLERNPQPENVREKIGLYSLSLDLMGWQSEKWLRDPEFLLSGNTPVSHGPADHNLNGCMTSSCLHDQESIRYIIRKFLNSAVESVRQVNMEKAILFAGVLLHFIQDGSAAGHIFPNSMFYEFSPEEKEILYNYHPMIDNCTPELSCVQPELLGTTIMEVAFRLSMLLEKNVAHAKRHFFPLLEACRDENYEKMDQIAKPMLQRAVFMGASLLHTVLAIGKERFDSDEVNSLTQYDLLEATPFNYHPGGGYRCLVKGASVVDDKLVPLSIDYGQGPEIIKDGIGLTSFCAIRYLLEPGAFSMFEGQVGLSSEYLQDQDPEMEFEFFISLDDGYNVKTASDLKYGETMKKVYSLQVKPDSQVQEFSVELKNAKTLLVAAITSPKMVNGVEKCWFPHFILVKPRLIT